MNKIKLPLNIDSNKQTKITNKIIPLFGLPLTHKELIDKKYNFNLQNSNLKNKLIQQNFTLQQILSLFTKGVQMYNNNINKILLHKNKLDLILLIKTGNYNIENQISKLNYMINRLISIVKFNSLTNFEKTNLFLNKYSYKINSNLTYHYNLINIINSKINSSLTIPNKHRKLKIEKIQLIELFTLGKEIKTELDYRITQNKNLINNIKMNKFLNSSIPLFVHSHSKNLISKDRIENIQNNSFDLLLYLNRSKLLITKIFNNFSLTKTNELKIIQTINSILKNKEFDYKTDSFSIDSNPIPLLYYNNINNKISTKPLINQYLKSMSLYNMKKKGILIYYSNMISFNFNKNRNKLIKNIYNLLVGSFKTMYCLISKPVFVITPDKIIIQFFYYLILPNFLHKKYKHSFNSPLNRRKFKKIKNLRQRQFLEFKKIKLKSRIKFIKLANKSLINIFPVKFEKLCEILSHLFKKPVELDLIRLHYPYNDSNILVQLLAILINKIKLRIIIRKLFNKAIIKNKFFINKLNIIPAFLSGISIKVAGRLLTHKVVPRKTVKITRRGSSARGKINFLDVARFTNKNKRGAFTITVTAGQNFV